MDPILGKPSQFSILAKDLYQIESPLKVIERWEMRHIIIIC
jgi:hypothetical protein